MPEHGLLVGLMLLLRAQARYIDGRLLQHRSFAHLDVDVLIDRRQYRLERIETVLYITSSLLLGINVTDTPLLSASTSAIATAAATPIATHRPDADGTVQRA